MNDTGFDPEIREWTRLADERLGALVSLMKPIVCFEGFTEEERQIVSWLSGASVRASGSALLLVGFEKVWDAEILSRSVFEGTLKFCHLLADRSKFQDRFKEYATVLPDINSLADHDKVQRLITAGAVSDVTFLEPLKELVLKEKQREQIVKRYPRNERRRLQTAWGFTGLIEQMIRSGESLGDLAAGFLHGYAMSSHVAHADFLGVGMVMEREYRDAKRRKVAHRAHVARVVSDQLWFCALRLIMGYRFVGEKREPVYDLMNDGSELWQRLSEAYRIWYRIEYGVELQGESDSTGGGPT